MEKRKSKEPPVIASRILRKLVNDIMREGTLGDFTEEYGWISEEKGRLIAFIWYWMQIIQIIPSFVASSIKWSFAMLKSYFTITFRTLKRQKIYSFINIFGLAFGMAASILILLWIRDELSFDRFHKNADTIFHINVTIRDYTYASAPSPLASALKNEIPEVLDVGRILIPGTRIIRSEKGVFYENGFTYTDPSIFKIFTFPFISGNPETALKEPYSIVITEKISKKYFGEENPVGKTISLDNMYVSEDNKSDYIITGVIKDIPDNSHLRINFLASNSTFGTEPGNWNAPSFYTYVLLREGTDVEELNAKVYNFIQDYDPTSTYTISLEPLTGIYFNSNLRAYDGPRGDIKYVCIFSLIAFFILLIACINFMNLTTARSGIRFKEIGIRKVIGAQRKTLIKQFFGESLIMSFISLVFALLLVELCLPVFNELSSKNISGDFLNNVSFCFGFMSVALFTGILSGIYPALYLSSFQPAQTLAGRIFSGRVKSHFRKFLVVVQFSISIFLIIATTIISKQVSYINDKNLGYDKEHIVVVEAEFIIDTPFEAVKNALLMNSNVLGVTAAFQPPLISIKKSANSSFFGWEGKDLQDKTRMNYLDVEYDFIDVFNIKILQGRNFSKEFSTDKKEGFIVNEEAAKLMATESPVGKSYNLFQDEGKVIGLVENFHFQPFHFKIEPLTLRIAESQGLYHYIFIKVNSEDISDSISYIKNVFGKFNPGYPFEYSFLDDSFKNLYRAEERTNRLFDYFTILAICISCLGLFGLTAFMAEHRTKEIGIRKVLGASVSNIVSLLSKEFVIPVIFATIIALPVGFLIMNKWLDNFAYKINMTIWVFIVSALLAFFIALFTVSFQAIKAAVSNPIDSLKYE